MKIDVYMQLWHCSLQVTVSQFPSLDKYLNMIYQFQRELLGAIGANTFVIALQNIII